MTLVAKSLKHRVYPPIGDPSRGDHPGMLWTVSEDASRAPVCNRAARLLRSRARSPVTVRKLCRVPASRHRCGVRTWTRPVATSSTSPSPEQHARPMKPSTPMSRDASSEYCCAFSARDIGWSAPWPRATQIDPPITNRMLATILSTFIGSGGVQFWIP